MSHASPCRPYLAGASIKRSHRSVRRLVTAMTASDSITCHKRGRHLPLERRRGDSMTAYVWAFACSRALGYLCAYEISKKWCHSVIQLIGVRFTNELTNKLGDGACCHLLSLLSRLTWRASR